MKRRHRKAVQAEVARHDDLERGTVCSCGKPFEDWTEHVDREMWLNGYNYAREERLSNTEEISALRAEVRLLKELLKAYDNTPEKRRAARLKNLKTPLAGDVCDPANNGGKHHERCTVMGGHDWAVVSDGKGWHHVKKEPDPKQPTEEQKAAFKAALADLGFAAYMDPPPGTPWMKVETNPAQTKTYTTTGLGAGSSITWNPPQMDDGMCHTRQLHRAHRLEGKDAWCSGGHPVVSCETQEPHAMHATEPGDLCRGVDGGGTAGVGALV